MDLDRDTEPVYVLNGDGTMRDGWPAIPGFRNIIAPIIADLDGDFSAEILGTGPSRLYTMRADGTEFRPSWWAPVSTTVACGDLDGDGRLEIVTAGVELYLFDIDQGLIATTSHPDHTLYEGMVIADTDGDGMAEIASWSKNGATGSMRAIHLLDHELQERPGWPLVFDTVFGGTIPELGFADLDVDGDVELIYRSTVGLEVLDLPHDGPEPARVEWAMPWHDSRRGGYYHANQPSPRPRFLRGDANHDGTLHLIDAYAFFVALFAGTGDDPCPSRFDYNDDGALEIADGVDLLNYLFIAGPAPPPRTVPGVCTGLGATRPAVRTRAVPLRLRAHPASTPWVDRLNQGRPTDSAEEPRRSRRVDEEVVPIAAPSFVPFGPSW